jgi:hypothetical protein
LHNLNKSGRKDQFEILVSFLADSSDKVVAEAATALGKTGNSQAIPNLQAALKKCPGKYSDTALSILYSLVQLGQKPDISRFLSDLDAPDLRTRVDAANTLIKLAALDFSLVRGQWNFLAAKIQKPNVDHNDGKNIYFSDCGGHEDHTRHTDSPGIGVRIPEELRARR